VNRALDIAGQVACSLGAVLAALVTSMLTPLYWGSVLVPLSVLLAVMVNVVLPLLARRLARSPLAAVVPYLLWLLTVILLASSRPEGDVLLPANRGAQSWVTYGMLAGGALAGGLTVAMQTMGRTPAPPDASDQREERPAEAPERR
jgi:hypothetical protein